MSSAKRMHDQCSGSVGFGGTRGGFGGNNIPLQRGFTRIPNEKINVKNNNGNGGVKPMTACAVNFKTKQIKTTEGPTVRINQLSRFEQTDWHIFFNAMTRKQA